MKISSVLRRSSSIHGPSPLCIDLNSGRTIDYRSFWDITRRHRDWIERTIRRILNSSTSTWTDTRPSIVPTTTDFHSRHLVNSPPSRQPPAEERRVDIIIAYLSNNSLDLICSVLGCIDGSSIVATPRITCLPAMLNARWTSTEIATALRIPPSDGVVVSGGSEECCKHVTMVLYGPGLEDTARRSISMLRDFDEGGGMEHHAVHAFPIPKLSVMPMTSNVVSSSDAFLSDDDPILRTEEDDSELRNDAILLFTSGSSSAGGAKGVRLSHESLLVQCMAKLMPPCSYDSDTVMIANTVPFFHVGGIGSFLALFVAGGCLVFFSDRDGSGGGVFRPRAVLETLSTRLSDPIAQSANTLVVVPAMLYALVRELQETTKNANCDGMASSFPDVRLILVGGQSLSKDQLRQTIMIFPKARIVQTYACTEAGSSLTFATLVPHRHHFDPNDGDISQSSISSSMNKQRWEGDYVGIPPPHVDITIRSQRDNAIVPNGTVGIIATRGPHVMNGYWTRAAPTDPTRGDTTSQRWFLTNDLGYLDHRNRLHFCGRANDVIRTGGETVFAPEVERVLLQLEGVEECAVFAMQDERLGERVSAAIVLRDKHEDEARNVDWVGRIREHCELHQLAGYKKPRRVFVMEDLPRNSSGKIVKYQLVEMLSGEEVGRSKL